MDNITYDKLLVTVCVIMILITAYNTIMTARKNHRDEVTRKSQPTHTLEETVKSHEIMLASDKRRIESLESEMRDTRDGIKHLVRGVNALIEHELHNGNAQQMQDASNDLSKWVTNKI